MSSDERSAEQSEHEAKRSDDRKPWEVPVVYSHYATGSDNPPQPGDVKAEEDFTGGREEEIFGEFHEEDDCATEDYHPPAKQDRTETDDIGGEYEGEEF